MRVGWLTCVMTPGKMSPEKPMSTITHEDLRQAGQQRLEEVLLERLDSGRSVEMDDADFRRIRETS